MRDILPNDAERCAGELAGEGWGHAGAICCMREHCKRYIQHILDYGKKEKDFIAWRSGWACATEDKEMRIPLEQQVELLQ